MMSAWWGRAGAAIAIAVSGCGGSNSDVTANGIEARRQPLMQAGSDNVDALFDWAQQQYPSLFPGLPTTQSATPWRYRHYPGSGNYLGVSGERVAVLGPLTNGAVIDVGSLADFRCRVQIESCTDTAVARVQNGGSVDYGLTGDGRLVYVGRAPSPFGEMPRPESAPIAGSAMSLVAQQVRQFEVRQLPFLPGGMYLDEHGDVFAWGSDINGWIGGRFGSTEIVARPRRLPWPGSVRQIAFAGNVAVALLADGTVWKLPGSTPSPLAGDMSVRPALVAGSVAIRHLGQGGPGLHVVTEGGDVLAADADLTRLAPVPNARDVTKVVCAARCLGVQSDGRVVAWGQVPLGDGSDRGSGAAVQTLLPAGIVQVAANSQSAMALTASGALWVWGGDETERSARRRLVPVRHQAAGDVIDIHCNQVCLLRRSDGTVWQVAINGIDAQGRDLPAAPLVAVPGLSLF